LLSAHRSIHTPAVVVMPAHSTALAKAPRTPPSVSPSPVPVSSQLIRQTPRVSQCPDRPPPETALESSACECNLLPRDRRLVHLLLARHGPLMHACTAAAPSPKVICSRGSSCRRVQQYVSFRHSTFPLGYLVMHFLWTVDLGHGSTKSEYAYVSCMRARV
jgi:hypothetical protein